MDLLNYKSYSQLKPDRSGAGLIVNIHLRDIESIIRAVPVIQLCYRCQLLKVCLRL